jgi:uncharacterized protein YbaA (DUF1428 family)
MAYTVRDAAVQKLLTDPRMAQMAETMPFEMQRMISGGFRPINECGTADRPGYIDGWVLPVPSGNEAAYKEAAQCMSEVFVEYGATRVVDAWGDDVPNGEVTDFTRAVDKHDDERVVYAWIEWPSKEIRDSAWPKAMADARVTDHAMPFDGKRLIYGGFRPPLLDA